MYVDQFFSAMKCSTSLLQPIQEPGAGMMSFNSPDVATGAQAIAEKLRTLTFQTISHSISTMDIQPTYDNCILIVVTGVLKVRGETLLEKD
jgi:hypothetical protein